MKVPIQLSGNYPGLIRVLPFNQNSCPLENMTDESWNIYIYI